MFKKIIFLAILAVFLFPKETLATIGVGVGTGKIVVEEELYPGQSYQLPTLTVINTGDESSDYSVSVTYHEDQTEARPPESWFDFTPQTFFLEPGEVQVVEVKINLPVKTTPSQYFAYLEGHPEVTTESGGTTIGVAAAAKLYFEVSPANLYYGLYYKAISFWNNYAPWTNVIFAATFSLLVILVLKRFINVNVGLKGKGSEKKEERKKEGKEQNDTES